MKLNIIGPSCVGKSTFASILAKESDWPHFDLDTVIVDHEVLVKTRRFIFRSPSVYFKEIQSILCENQDWIIEGVYAIESIFRAADMIILIQSPLLISLQRQWARYFSSNLQREHYGFRNNLYLTRSMILQYWSRPSPRDLHDTTKFYLCKYDLMLKEYQKKLRRIKYAEDHEMVVTRCKELEIL